MFDGIARRYDLLNHVLSFGRDVAWRKRLARRLAEHPARRILDLATGTGDVLLAVAGQCRGIQFGVGLDMAGEMLVLGKSKIARRRLDAPLSLVRCDALAMAFPDGAFDAATVAFGIRNMPDPGAAFREMHRVIRPGASVLALEFSLPRNGMVRAVYLFYFRRVLPGVGRLISRDPRAYRYLNESVEAFPHGEAFGDLMRAAGFRKVTATPLTFGIATLYEGSKIPEGPGGG